MKYWVFKDRNGSIHLSNVKPRKPSEVNPNNPNANDSIFWIYDSLNGTEFFIPWYEDIPGLTFENSPREVQLTLI